MTDAPLGPSSAQITIMGHNIAAAITDVARRRRRRARLVIAGTAAAIALGVSAAAIAISAVPPEYQAGTFRCYTSEDLSGPPIWISYTDPDGASSADPSGTSEIALEVCAAEYDQIGITVHNPTVCELPDLRLAVLPNARDEDPDEFCPALGFGVPED